jgi:antitoxin VapB
MATARVFKSGNSQAVRLPKRFRVKSKELEISRRGDEIVLREKAHGLERAFEILANLPDDALPKKRKDSQPQRRKGL